MTMKRLAILAGLAAALLLPLPTLAQDTSPPPPTAEQAGGGDSVYRLGADDKIRIVVYGEEPLTGDYIVGSDGNLSFPLIGIVKASGLTLIELQDQITKQLSASYVNDPKVSAQIAEYRPFYILGEVNKPGQYPYRAGLTIHAAVATAGGFTYRANKKRLAIQHNGQDGETKVAITPDMKVQPGDTIRILERFF